MMCITYIYIVTCIPIARQRVGKHVPTHVHVTVVGHPLLGTAEHMLL